MRIVDSIPRRITDVPYIPGVRIKGFVAAPKGDPGWHGLGVYVIVEYPEHPRPKRDHWNSVAPPPVTRSTDRMTRESWLNREPSVQVISKEKRINDAKLKALIIVDAIKEYDPVSAELIRQANDRHIR